MRKLLAFAVILHLSFIALCLAADSVGKAQNIFDNGTGKAALVRLHDNHDGTKSVVVYAVSLPSPTNTPTPTPTATFTPTATPTP